MNLITLTIPDEESELRAWLEDAVVRGEAGQLADELHALQGTTPSEVSALPDEIATKVRERGFIGLSDSHVRTLLKNPRLLTSLAEDIFANGGVFWDRRLAAEPTYGTRDREGWQRIQRELFPVSPRSAPKAERRSFSPAAWISAFATAAIVLLAVLAIPGLRNALVPGAPQQEMASNPWGWQKTGELAAITKPADYLDKIASLAEEWKTRDSTTATALAERITEFRQGCAKIQLMPHPPISEPQRQDLLARCKKWAVKFDTSLATLEATGDVARVRSEMDATVAQLATALRVEAAKLRAG